MPHHARVKILNPLEENEKMLKLVIHYSVIRLLAWLRNNERK